ncbi:Gfo/Idh/MocA family protein [Rhizobium jaguaris]|uniref:Gfo/Idh/MocA family oxidoreductase n=1 Tax=Rhizobium jaguaris TaxID=1312183 RepID=A0A387FWL3_9HYPH|nr:Gfo/Idh/MocA family oxidoreductase [Rhizobium jaguaris]AYG63029.1 gfo/Idh/MocA family oxidoreductase [Rhizobium jaguaris]
MSQAVVFKLLGRRVRLGLIGGAQGSLIGPVHRTAARIDDCFDLAAGVFSSDPERSLISAHAFGIRRGYTDVQAMIEAETVRADGIDAVAIMTPNDSHYEYAATALDAGLDVICDKPLTNDYDSALALARKAHDRGRILSLTHNYSGYPMVREARATITGGEIGALRLVNVRYVQGSLSRPIEAEPDKMAPRTKWRLDAAKGGKSHVLGDIGVHAHQLMSFVCGRRITAVLADVGPSLPGRTAHDTAQVILKFDDGTRGQMLVSKVATGAQNVVSIEAYGEEGGISWNQAEANDLRVMRLNRADEVRTRGLPSLHPHAQRGTRLPTGHPEAFFEAFANIYTDFAELVAARIAGAEPVPLAQLTPNAWIGVDGLAYIDACLESTATGTWAEVVYEHDRF